MNISFFAKDAFLNINPSEKFKDRKKPIRKGVGYLMRVSSIIRGDQIADYIGAKMNPTEGYENDVCIYVKPHVDKGGDIKLEGRPYIDIIDGHNLGQLALQHKDAGVIVCSKADYYTMSTVIPNKLILIPQHHCNFERLHRTRKEVTTVGVIGTPEAFGFLPKGLKEELNKMGMELLEYSRFFSRQEIVDFYQKIDIQIVWRPYKKLLSNPLKIVNASSFGVPTVALYEKAFDEMTGCYLPVRSVDELLYKINGLKESPSAYYEWIDNCITKSEDYHISKIAELYKALC